MHWRESFEQAKQVLLRQQEIYTKDLNIIAAAKKLELYRVIPSEIGRVTAALNSSEASLFSHNNYIDNILGTLKEIEVAIETNSFNSNYYSLRDIIGQEIFRMEKEYRSLYLTKRYPFSSAGELIMEGLQLMDQELSKTQEETEHSPSMHPK